MEEWNSKKYYKGKLRGKYEWTARIIKILPDELTKLPTTFEEFQDFYFYWEPSEDMERLDNNLKKSFKLAMWNARKIKDKSTEKVTKREKERIYELFRGHHWISWKDSDNPARGQARLQL